MRTTYRVLLGLLQKLTDDQLDCDITVEDGFEGECYPASLRICGDNHDSLDENHPVIYFFDGNAGERVTDLDIVAKSIGLGFTPPTDDKAVTS